MCMYGVAQLAPLNRPLMVCCSCCNQFLLSRKMVQRRPLEVWKKLLKILGEQQVCHIGKYRAGCLYL